MPGWGAKKSETVFVSSWQDVVTVEKVLLGKVMFGGKKKLGAIELKPKREFYDYEAKYNPKSNTKHIIPVNITKKEFKTVTDIALKAHKVIGCKGVTRSDFKFFKGKFYLLELNTQPGMTKLSLVPEIARYKGISFIKLIEWILKDASINR